MAFVAWVVLGLAAGFIGSQLVNRRGKGSCLTSYWESPVPSPEAGCTMRSDPRVNGLHLYSYFAAVMGSLVLLLPYHALSRG